MTGPEHYRRAEELIAEHERSHGPGVIYTITPIKLTLAAIHAQLALAAATVDMARWRVPEGIREAWDNVL